MRYSDAIDGAMKVAKKDNKTYTVYGIKRRWWFGYDYNYTKAAYFDCVSYFDKECVSYFDKEFNNLKQPMIKFMTITANGRCI